jgi:hypothetical protein
VTWHDWRITKAPLAPWGQTLQGTPRVVAPSLERLAASAVARLLDLPEKKVVALTNVDKYREAKSPQTKSARTVRVFELMRALNLQGLADPRLGLRDALDETLDDLAFFLRGRAVRYIELGPEPIKTSAILDGLCVRGVAVERYLGIDVNPASPARMAPALRQRLSAENIGFRLSRYQDLQPFGREGDTVNLVTMLGFEEGNEDPRELGALLGRLLAPGDMLLSEMQVCDAGWDAVQRFYTGPTMRSFSLDSPSSRSGKDSTRASA